MENEIEILKQVIFDLYDENKKLREIINKVKEATKDVGTYDS